MNTEIARASAFEEEPRRRAEFWCDGIVLIAPCGQNALGRERAGDVIECLGACRRFGKRGHEADRIVVDAKDVVERGEARRTVGIYPSGRVAIDAQWAQTLTRRRQRGGEPRSNRRYNDALDHPSL